MPWTARCADPWAPQAEAAQLQRAAARKAIMSGAAAVPAVDEKRGAALAAAVTHARPAPLDSAFVRPQPQRTKASLVNQMSCNTRGYPLLHVLQQVTTRVDLLQHMLRRRAQRR